MQLHRLHNLPNHTADSQSAEADADREPRPRKNEHQHAAAKLSAAGSSRAVEAVAAKRMGVLVGDGVCLFIIQHFIWDQEGGEEKKNVTVNLLMQSVKTSRP